MKPIVLAINGSINPNSANEAILNYLNQIADKKVIWRMPRLIETLPWFSPERDKTPPYGVQLWRKQIEEADVLVFSTPEYIFSLPGVLKNALEWLVSTMVLDKKPLAIITAAATGEAAHASLKLILETMGADIIPQCSLLISGAKGKITAQGEINDENLKLELGLILQNIQNLRITEPA